MKLGGVKAVTTGVFALLFAGALASVCAQQPSPEEQNAKRGADLRVETIPVDGGAEVVTVFARNANNAVGESREMPLLSVLRDTLGDDKKENDKIRYVWMLTYTNPSLAQKAAAGVPFLYTRTTNKADIGTGPPPKLVDLNGTTSGLWSKVGWNVFRKIVLSSFGPGVRAPALQYQENLGEYRRSAVARALAVLSVYDTTGDKALSETERHDIAARLALRDKIFGGHMQSDNLERAYKKMYEKNSDYRNQNWELLRQYSEAQGLYFEPLKLPDGTARHGIVWAAAEDVTANRDRKYNSRFLNIKNPWTDPKLLNWKGYSERRWFNTDGREVEENTPDAKERTMIPLALYGLDHPKIPALLIDFRSSGNAKRREISRRVIHDVTSNVLAVSPFSSVPYLVGRYFFDWVTARRGIDLNQISRVKSYSQLKLLLEFDDSLSDGLRKDIAERIEDVSINPLENDVDVEARVARQQYENLMAYAKRPDGLPAKIQELRREEMVTLNHSPKARAWYGLAHTFTLGLYTHREEWTPDMVAKIDTRRQLEFHERRVAEVARQSIKPEVDANVSQLRDSLSFISLNGSAGKDKTARSLAKVFAITDDTDLRDLCLAGLYKINNATAKNELLAIYSNPKTEDRVRALSAHYLKLAAVEGQRISSRNAAAIAAIGGTGSN